MQQSQEIEAEQMTRVKISPYTSLLFMNSDALDKLIYFQFKAE